MMDAIIERLVILAEESAEVGQAVSKILRFGPNGKHPTYQQGITNREALEKEIGDVLGMVYLLTSRGYLSAAKIQKAKRAKLKRVAKYLKHP
jgi:NTP pyrophosphatase (non-canonical NTP hydrolase)